MSFLRSGCDRATESGFMLDSRDVIISLILPIGKQRLREDKQLV